MSPTGGGDSGSPAVGQDVALSTGPVAPVSRRIAAVEITAVLCLTVGAFVVPVVAPLVGLAFAWCSRFWRLGDKVAVTVLMVVPLIPVIVLAVMFRIYDAPDYPSDPHCTDILPDGTQVPVTC